jgi:hypothetical protein
MRGLQLGLFRDRLCALPSFRGRGTWRFVLDNRTLNKISTAASLRRTPRSLVIDRFGREPQENFELLLKIQGQN